MGATERTVRHLRLRAGSEASVRRAALKLEDALRCASLPDAGARVLLVRRLDLGVMAPGASPQTLSLLLEQRVAAAGATWVHGADPGAERADCVFFHNALEARCELALRLARTAPCTAWYWALAVPEFKPAEGAPANLRRIALAVAALPEAPAALPAWTARLTAAGAAPALAQAIGPVQAAALLRAARLSAQAPERSRASGLALPESPRLASGTRDAGHAGESPRREVAPAFAALPSWVQTLARAGGLVPRAAPLRAVAPTAQAETAAGPNRTGGGRAFQKHRDVEMPSAPSVFVEPDTGAKDASASPVSERMKAGSARLLEQMKAGTARLPYRSDRITTEAGPKPSLGGRAFLNAVPSACGGLLFLLPVLQRLGYAAWAERLPESAAAQVAKEMLASALRRLPAPSNDPAWLLAGASLNEDFGDIAQDFGRVIAPATWSDPVLAAPRGHAGKDIVALTEHATSAAALAQLWLIACRRWLRRVARIGLASLVMRPAALGLTATHAEVFFRLSEADMRVRCAGLDFDPGWVPWLGRVVMFHYDHEGCP